MKNTDFEKLINTLNHLPEELSASSAAEIESRHPELSGIGTVLENTGTAFARAAHPDELMLAELILAEGEGKELSPELQKISGHVQNCFLCRQTYAALQEDVPVFRNTVSPAKTGVTRKRSAKRFDAVIYRIKKASIYTSRIAAVILLFILSLYGVSELVKPQNIRLGQTDIEIEGITRTLTADQYSAALVLIDNDEISGAIDILEREIANAPEDAGAFYTHYITGLLRFSEAEYSWFGLFKGYDTKQLASASADLELAIEKNTSGKYENVTYDASFYLAKTYILRQKYDKAKELLQYVIASRGSKAGESEKLLKELH